MELYNQNRAVSKA